MEGRRGLTECRFRLLRSWPFLPIIIRPVDRANQSLPSSSLARGITRASNPSPAIIRQYSLELGFEEGNVRDRSSVLRGLWWTRLSAHRLQLPPALVPFRKLKISFFSRLEWDGNSRRPALRSPIHRPRKYPRRPVRNSRSRGRINQSSDQNRFRLRSFRSSCARRYAIRRRASCGVRDPDRPVRRFVSLRISVALRGGKD